MFSIADFYQNLYRPAFPLNYSPPQANYGHEQAAAAAAILASQYQYQLQQLHQFHHEQFQHLHPLLTQQLSPSPLLSPPPLPGHQIQSPFLNHLLESQQHQRQPQAQQPLLPLPAPPLQQQLQQQSPEVQPATQQQIEPISNNTTGDGNSESRSEVGKRSRPKKYQCPYCWVALSNTGQFKGHVRIHTGERPFICDFHNCGKSFTRNEELTRHKRIHTGLRPYACVRCNKCFGRKDHLKKHLRTHDRQDTKNVSESNDNNDENDATIASLNVSDMDNETPSPTSSNETLAFSIDNLTRE